MIKHLYQLLILTASFLLLAGGSHAQQFPVQINANILPPYSVYLSDYADPVSSPLNVSILLRQTNRSQYQARLKIRIEGQGVTLTTRENYIPRPIILEGGVTSFLTGADLAGYLNPNNLNIIGMPRGEFINNGALPEGFYTFTIEVFDFQRNRLVSNSATANAWLVLNDPPLLNLPFNGDKILAQDPQRIVFTWTPLHTSSPNAAFTTEYEFTMIELQPNMSPDIAIRSSLPIYQETTTSTTLLYGITEPLLIAGKTYAYRVQARNQNSQKDLFKNNGFSEVFSFQYGDACTFPEEIVFESLGHDRVKLSWEKNSAHTEFTVEHKRASSENWISEQTFLTSLIIPDLVEQTQYEARVKAKCGIVQSDFSAVQAVSTDEYINDQLACGVNAPTINVEATPIQEAVLPGDIITSGDFSIKVEHIEQSDKGFTGTGFMQVPFLNFAKVRVWYKNIRINPDFQVYSGNIVTTYNLDKNFVQAYDEETQQFDNGPGGSGNAGEQKVIDPALVTAVAVEGEISGLDAFHPTAEGTLLVLDANGETLATITLPEEGKFVEVTDSNGDQYTVNDQGDVVVGSAAQNYGAVPMGGGQATAGASGTRSNAEDQVVFQQSTGLGNHYGFDQKEYSVHVGNYSHFTIGEEHYYAPWQSVATGRTAQVVVKTNRADGTFPDNLSFKIGETEVIPAAGVNEGEKLLTVIGKGHEFQEELIAYQTVTDEEGKESAEVAGQLNIISYDHKVTTVKIVPVNGVSITGVETLESSLDEIFAQAAMDITLEVEANFQVAKGLLEDIDTEASGTLASYPKPMRKLIRAYGKERGDQSNTYYIFLIPNGTRLKGFMPRKRQYGFLFMNNVSGEEERIKTLAHELAHGAFRLKHTFSTYPGLAERSTDNLMDYRPTGLKLRKYQWDNIHNPQAVWGLTETDEEGASVTLNNIEELKGWEYNDIGYAFLAPSGEVVLLPKTVKSIKFSTGDLASTIDENRVAIIPFGSLISFNPVQNNDHFWPFPVDLIKHPEKKKKT